MRERQLVTNAIRAIRTHKRLAKNSAVLALSYTGELKKYHWKRAIRAARIARIEFESLYN